METNYYKIDKMSFSKLFLFDKTAKHFSWFKDVRYESDAMIFGNAVHTNVLEPHLFNQRYINEEDIIIPTPVEIKKKELKQIATDKVMFLLSEGEADPTKKEITAMIKKEQENLPAVREEDLPLNKKLKHHREWLELYYQDQNQPKILKKDDYQMAGSLAHSVQNNEECSLLLHETLVYEKEYFWEFEGIEFKSKVDMVGDGWLGDLKTIKDGILDNNKSLFFSIIKRGYDVQAAMYAYAHEQVTGQQIVEYNLMFVEKKAPFVTRIVILDYNDLLKGFKKFKKLVNKYKAFKNGFLDASIGYETVNFSELIDNY